MNALYLVGILIFAVVLFALGEIIMGLVCLYGSYHVLMMYNRFKGNGEPGFTFEQCKEEWEEREQERGR